MLEDPSRSVRVEAARVLTGAPVDLLDADQRRALNNARREYEQALAVAADVPSGQLNLGRISVLEGRNEQAEKHFQEAIRMDPRFTPAPLALASMYNQQERNDEAERVLRDALELSPDDGEVHYSLGLLVAEGGRLPEAERWLRKAFGGVPGPPARLLQPRPDPAAPGASS